MSSTRRSEQAGNSPIRKGRTIKQQKQSSSRWIWLAAIVGVVLVVALLATQLIGRSTGDISGVQTFSVVRDHTNDPVTYEQSPPVGGIHNPVWQNCGIY